MLRVAEGGEMEFSQPGCESGISVPGAFKLVHLQPVKPILFSNLSTFILGANSYYTRERKAENGKMSHLLRPMRTEKPRITELDCIIGGFWRFSADGADSAVYYCLSQFRVRQNLQ